MKTKSKFEFDDSFTPTHATFTEGEKVIEIFITGDSARIQVFTKATKDRSSFELGMRVPLWAMTALAQMLTKTLNGQRLAEWKES